MTIIFKKRFYRIELNNSSNKIYIYYDHWINQLNLHTTSLGSLSMDKDRDIIDLGLRF